jgi:hypothetical protein
MMPDVEPQVTVQPAAIQGPDKAALLLRLDERLETYLHTLDRYQKAQQQLSSHFSSVSWVLYDTLCIHPYESNACMPQHC